MAFLARLTAALIFIVVVVTGQVHVRGHVRRDGTYVQPHYRSNPDGSFYNNWSTKGNVNPYTGEPGRLVTPPSGSIGGSGSGSLLEYYRSIGRPPEPRIGAPGAASPSSSRTIWTPPPGLSKLPAFPDALPEEEVVRFNKYCGWLHDRDDLSMNNCRNQQRRVLASIVLPDYSEFPQVEVMRSGRYCEWLYGDNRASFYDCFNRQVFGLAKAEPSFSSQMPDTEASRSKRYCEWMYGDNRASYRQCLEAQVTQLRAHWPVNSNDLPGDEWGRSQQYCEWLYGNNRGSASQCLSQQAAALRQYLRIGTMAKAAPEKARSYCEWLHSNNRASFWECLAQRQ